jgi:hypothetical protein
MMRQRQVPSNTTPCPPSVRVGKATLEIPRCEFPRPRMSTNASTTGRSPKSEVRAIGTRLRPRPVRGSAVLSLLPSEPRPRAARASLPPVPGTSPARARGDTELFPAHCQASIHDGFGDIAVILVPEPVANACKATGTGVPSGVARIDLSSRLLDGCLLIEVIDSPPKTPTPSLTDDAERESWRGLAAADCLRLPRWPAGRHHSHASAGLDARRGCRQNFRFPRWPFPRPVRMVPPAGAQGQCGARPSVFCPRGRLRRTEG